MWSRTFTVYVQASSVPTSGSNYTITENGTATPTLTFVGSLTTPLGSGWYELGTVTLGSSDLSSKLTVSYSGSGVTQIGLVQPPSDDTYTTTGLVASETNGNDGVTNYGYDALGEQTSETAPAPNPNVPNVRPVATVVYDAIGRVTAQTDPLGNTTAYTYDSGSDTDSVTTWQGQTLAAASGDGTVHQPAAGPLARPDRHRVFRPSGGDVQPGAAPGLVRTYVVYVQSTSTPSIANFVFNDSGAGSITLGSFITPTLPLQLSGNNWHELCTVTLGSNDESSTLTVGYLGTIEGVVTGIALGLARTYVVYVQSPSQPTSGTITENGTGSPTFNFVGSATTLLGPSGSGWYELGMVTLDCGDASSSLTVSSSGVTQIALLAPTSADTYDAGGNLMQEVNALGNTIKYSYNNLGQPAQVPVNGNPLGPLFDEAGNVISNTDLMGNITSYAYDAFGNQVSQTDPLGNITQYSYDVDGDLLTRSDPDPADGQQDSGSPLTQYSYDAFGNQVSQALPIPASGKGAGRQPPMPTTSMATWFRSPIPTSTPPPGPTTAWAKGPGRAKRWPWAIIPAARSKRPRPPTPISTTSTAISRDRPTPTAT